MRTPPHAGNSEGDPGLDAGLRAAFGGPSRAPHSVLEAIERITGEAPRILLRDPVSDQGASPLIDPSSSEKRSIPQGRGSYQILGEIARGGMGVVMKGHDTDLGRDVALKVLHKELAKRPEVLQRFVEEAQIGGQLQHPGIVPVYELGLMADERPYFTMKLVKGRTLAALLAERKSGDVDRRRLLDVFESVCQTMAYAHSRGVIHRDLKPANVMVGAFGEVQVVDWGLAKVLRQGGTADEKRQKQTNISIIETVRSEPGSHGSNSLVGSVMGTPAYMSPEQARGEIEKLDERSDVFSLGAVLCEILTGMPPYTGEADKTLIEAANARLDDATKRLDACKADAELVALCRQCLAPAQSARPLSAEVIAQRIHEHLVSVEERARAAQIDAAEARVRAREERRARKLAVSLAASVLGTLALAGGGWAWTRSEREARLRHTTDQVSAALADARLAQGAKDWSAALAAIARAKASLEAGQASDELRSRVSGASIAVEGDASMAREARAREVRNAAFLQGLERIRSLEHGMLALRPSSDDGSSRVQAVATSIGASTLERRETAYVASFRAFGIDVDSQAEASVSESLKSSGIASELALACDDWAAVRFDIDNGFNERSKRLVHIAMNADPDPWRRDLRAAILSEDPARLPAFASTARERELAPVTAIVLAKALARSKRGEESLAVLQKAVSEHPADFPLLLQFGRRLLVQGLPRLSEALRYLTAAHALRPESTDALDSLAEAYHDAKDLDRAIWMLREAIRLDPDNSAMRNNLGVFLTEKGDLEGAVESFRKATELDPKLAIAHCNLGFAHAKRHDFDALMECSRKAIEIDARWAWAHSNYATALAEKGELDAAVASFRTAIGIEPRDALSHHRLGIVLYRQHDLDGAIASFRTAIALGSRLVALYCTLGDALSAKGDFGAAIENYNTAIQIDAQDATGSNGLAWMLATCADPARRNGVEAVRLARSTVGLAPNADNLNTLGVALCCVGEWKGAIDALDQSLQLIRTDSEFGRYEAAIDHCFLATARAHLGELDEARADFALAVSWHEAHPEHANAAETGRFLDEARAAIEAGAKR